MGLTRWDQPNDTFSYTELSDNFNLIDLHDHTSTKGVQIPSDGLANLAVTETKIANNAITVNKVLNATLTDAKLASPNNGVWHTILSAQGRITPLGAPGLYVMGNGGTTLALASGNLFNPYDWFPLHINVTDYAVAGKTAEFRFKAMTMINSVAPASNYTFGLAPVTAVAGASGNTITATLGTVVGATALNAPAASTRHVVTSASFALTTDFYTPTINVSATPATGSTNLFFYQLQRRNV
jgi:hypothetical protein